MYDYYCKNCKNNIGKFYENYFHYILKFCDLMESENNNLINFMTCKNCNKFVGLLCQDVCNNCFREDEIFEEENLFNWFQQYKKINQKFLNNCEICNKKNFRTQLWFFEELTFQK